MDTNLTSTIQDLFNQFIFFIPKIVTALVVFVLALFFSGVISRTMRRALERRNADPEITLLIGKISRWTIIVLGIIVSLDQVDFNVTAFLAGLGIAGFTVGFALQDVSKNFVAGMLLLLQQPFDIGEAIEVGEFSGTVEEVNLRATELRTFDGRHVLIPNADVFTSAIVNFSRAKDRRIEVSVGVAYESDLDLVRDTALEAIQSVKGVKMEPEPFVAFHTFGGTTMDFTLYYWADMAETSPVNAKDEGLALIKAAFEKAGIEMPFPTQTVLLEKQ
jgi:small conductance mechanosensitive channel